MFMMHLVPDAYKSDNVIANRPLTQAFSIQHFHFIYSEENSLVLNDEQSV